jgi:hypothetical protein
MDPASEKFVIGTFAARGVEVQTLILARSLREFGGELSQTPLWCYQPVGYEMSGDLVPTLKALDVDILPVDIEKKLLAFPFAGKAIASAAAEEKAAEEGLTLAWHDRTGMFKNTPRAFFLPEDILLGFRPTDIINIGAPFDQPLPPFWQRVCDFFNLDVNDLAPITTAIDQKTIHLYINAGLLVVRPEARLLRTWTEHLMESYDQPAFKPFYEEDQRYAIFMHQAALTAAVVQQTRPQERLILPDSYLFSVDNFFDYPEKLRPASLDIITTGRFHDFFSLDNWEDLITASDSLKAWFKEQLTHGPYWPRRS